MGYASAVAPRLLTLLLQHLTGRRRTRKAATTQIPEGQDDNIHIQHSQDSFLESLLQIIRGGLDPRRFPTFCAVVVGGSTLLEVRFLPPARSS